MEADHYKPHQARAPHELHWLQVGTAALGTVCRVKALKHLCGCAVCQQQRQPSGSTKTVLWRPPCVFAHPRLSVYMKLLFVKAVNRVVLFNIKLTIGTPQGADDPYVQPPPPPNPRRTNPSQRSHIPTSPRFPGTPFALVSCTPPTPAGPPPLTAVVWWLHRCPMYDLAQQFNTQLISDIVVRGTVALAVLHRFAPPHGGWAR